MERNVCIEGILEVLEECGFIVQYDGTDFSLSEYIEDSIQFMTILVELEDKFGIEFPDEMLQIDYFSSLFGLADIICELNELKKV